MAFVPRLAALADANGAACFAHLPDADRDALARILKNLARHFGVTAIAID